MTVEEKLKAYILKQYKSIREFTIDVDIPYSTVDNMFKRGIGGVGISTVIKLCNKLNIDVDALANGDICTKQSAQTTSTDLTAEEEYIIKSYREMNEQGKEYILQTVSMAANTYKKADNTAADNVSAG